MRDRPVMRTRPDACGVGKYREVFTTIAERKNIGKRGSAESWGADNFPYFPVLPGPEQCALDGSSQDLGRVLINRDW